MAEELQKQIEELKRDSTASQAKLIMSALSDGGYGLAASSGSVPSEVLTIEDENQQIKAEKFER